MKANTQENIVEIKDVFRTRDANINESMYVPRPDLEGDLKNKLDTPLNIVLHGESGCGKSWLYKKVFSDTNTYYVVANMSKVSRMGSINELLSQMAHEENGFEQIGYEEQKTAQVGAGFASADISNTKSFQRLQDDPLYKLLAKIRKTAQKRRAVLVFDNLEAILDNAKEVANLIGILMLVDDEEFAAYKVKLLLVGTSDEIRRTILAAKQRTTLSNRITEVREVSRFSATQTKEFIARGFFEILNFGIASSPSFNKSQFLTNMAYHCDMIPQHANDLSFHVAQACVSHNGRREISFDLWKTGIVGWIESHLVNQCTLVRDALSSGSRTNTQRNQVLYTLASSMKREFSQAEILALHKKEFPTNDKSINISKIMSDLTKSTERSILRKTHDGKCRFTDPKNVIALRWCLQKDTSTKQLTISEFDNSVGLAARQNFREQNGD